MDSGMTLKMDFGFGMCEQGGFDEEDYPDRPL